MHPNTKFSLSENIFIAQKENKYLFLNPNSPDWLVVNNNGAFILNLCDGKNSTNDIIKKISHQNDDKIHAEVHNLLNQAQSHSIITPEKANNKKHKNLSVSPYKLRIVHLKLTDDCNLRCKYCYAESGGKSEIFTLEQLSKILKDISLLSSSVEYVLSGGEPLLNPDCLAFAEKIKSTGNQAHLLSNGLLINKSNVSRIAETCDLVKISLDGASDEIHSLTRGKKNYDKVVAAIDLLNKHNANVLVAMTVTRKNLHEIPELVKRYGSQLTFQPFFNAGRGSENKNLALTGKEYFDALNSVSGVSPMSAIDKVLSRARNKGIMRCAIGDAEISISQNGDVFPCQMLDDPKFLAGNIYKTPILDIYNYSDVLKQVRKLNINTIIGCESCPVKLICGGACRARTYHENGQINVAGNFCEYERLAYINGIFDYSTLEPESPH